MNQRHFESRYAGEWELYAKLLTRLEKGEPAAADQEEVDFPTLHRRLCNHYGIARASHYSPVLVDRLHSFVLRGHRQLYTRRHPVFRPVLRFLLGDFPRSVRANHHLFWLAFLLLYGPAVLTGFWSYRDPTLMPAVLGEQQTLRFETMYSPENKIAGRDLRQLDNSDLMMFAHYVRNNISIGFRTFAGGIAGGIGTIFFLLFNGVVLGGVAGHLSHPPFQTVFWSFVCGHSSLELTAIVISGASGLLLAQSLLFPGEYRRLDSLRTAAPQALQLVMGAALLFFAAAFIEAFWSSAPLSAGIKYGVAVAGWVMVALYLLLGGRKTWTSTE